MLIGFARTRLDEVQSHDPVEALTKAGCQRIVAVAKEADRRELLDAVIKVLASGDTLVVPDLGTLNSGKSFADLLSTLHARGIGVRSLAEGFDSHNLPSTNSPVSKRRS